MNWSSTTSRTIDGRLDVSSPRGGGELALFFSGQARAVDLVFASCAFDTETSGLRLGIVPTSGRLSWLRNSDWNLTHRDAGGGSRPQHQNLTFALPKGVVTWPSTTLREKLVKIGAKVVRRGRYVTFQLAEVAVPSDLFQEILRLIDGLRRSAPAAA